MIHFQPDCTVPPEPPVFVVAPDVRSTMNIVWSCMSTILLCCWSVQHLNVPPQFQPKTMRQNIMRKLFLLWRKVFWMLITLFVPELILAKAMINVNSCRVNSPVLQTLADEDSVPWSKTHTFLADMGGFALRFTPSSHSAECQYPRAPSVNVDAESRMSPQDGSSETTIEVERGLNATENVQDQEAGQDPGHSVPKQPWPINYESQESIEACGSTQPTLHQSPSDGLGTGGQDKTTQRGPADISSPGIELSRLPSTAEQCNPRTTTSTKVAQQYLQSTTSGKTAAETWHKSQDWRKDYLKFRTLIKASSQRFGDVMWRPLEHNESNIAKVLSAPCAESLEISVLSTLMTFEGDLWVLTAAQLIEARKRKLFTRLPHLTEDEISDRSKGDVLFKLLALLQVSWMVIQIISRATLHVSSTPLEVMTLSYTACAFITYLLLLNHPQDINTSTYIDAARLPTVDDMRSIADLSPRHYWFATNRLPCVSNNSIHWPGGASVGSLYLVSGVGAAVFGGTHLLAWNSVFPTAVERTLWRTSSLVTLLVPLAILSLHWQQQGFRGRNLDYSRDRWLQPFLTPGMLALALARLFLIAEAFRSLYYLPRDAYSATWAANLPYWA